jgi:ClpP class serine protease
MPKQQPFNLYEAATGAPWLMTEAALERVLAIIDAHAKAPEWRPDLAALAKDVGRPLDNTADTVARATPHGMVAVIPVHGPIFPHANSLHAISGATTIETLSADFTAALRNDAVSAIVLSFDSPGGAVSGVAEFANEIRTRTNRKPVIAYVEQMAASAAYWLASAADRVFAGPSAEVGSIGVVLAGVKGDKREYEFVSRQSPNKRPDPETPEGKAQLVARASDIAGVFIAAVAAYRGVTPAGVEADFGKGGMLVASKALDAGMVDQVAHFADVLARGMWVDTIPRIAGLVANESTTMENADMSFLSKMFKGKEGESEKDSEARMERLVLAFGESRADFAMAQHRAGNDVPQAVAVLLTASDGEMTKLRADIAEKTVALEAAASAHRAVIAQNAALEAKVTDLNSRPPTGKGMGAPDKTEASDQAILNAMLNGANQA